MYQVSRLRRNEPLPSIFTIFVPGPGQYAPEKTKLDHTPKFSFGHKVETTRTSDAPGIIIT